MSEKIHKKIVVDENSKPLEVIISYDEWEKIEKLMTGAGKALTSAKLRKHIGILSLKDDPLDYQKRMRNEWQ